MKIIFDENSNDNNIIVLYDEQLHISNGSRVHYDKLNQITDMHDKSNYLKVISKLIISYDKITKIKYNKTEKKVDIYNKQSSLISTPTTLQFSNSEGAEQLYTSCCNEMPYFSSNDKQSSVFGAIIEPGVLLSMVIGFTYFLYYSAIQIKTNPDYLIENTTRAGRAILITKLLNILGDKGVLAIGAILSVASLIFMIKRVKNPPFYQILKK